MEQGTYLNPNPLALQRTSCQLLFKPTGQAYYDDLGVIEVAGVAMNPETDKVMFPINGSSVIGVQENTSISPVISMEGRQFTDQVEAYLNFGTLGADTVQSSASGATANITAALGKTFDIGARGVTLVSVTVSAVAKVRDTDFFFDEESGLIRFPFVAAGIAAGAAVVVTFDKPALTRKTYTGGSNLNFYGALKLLEKDNKSTRVRAEWDFATGMLSPKEPGSIDVKTNKKWGMDFSVSGQWTKLNRVS